MSYRRSTVRILIVLFCASLLTAMFSVVKARLQRGLQKTFEDETTFIMRRQAMKWVHRNTPFYYPFQTRATFMDGMYPFTQDFGSLARQNSHGFRTMEYTIAHPADTYRILILGDGVTQGIHIPLEQTYHHVFSNLLAQNCPQVQSEVIALGVGGHRLADQVIELFAHGRSLKPDLLLVQISTTSVDFYNYLNIFQFQGLADSYRAYSAKELEIFRQDTLDWRTFTESIDVIQQWSASVAVPVAFLLFPPIDTSRSGNNFNGYDAATVAHRPTFKRYEQILNELTERSMPVLNILKIFRERAGKGYLAISGNIGEWNAYANRLIAISLTEFLFDRLSFSCSSTRFQPGDSSWYEENALRNEASEKWKELSGSCAAQLEFYERLSKLYPQDPWVRAELADTYFCLGRWQDALSTYGSLSEIAEQYTAPWYHMALSAGGGLRSKQLLEKMLKFVPDHTNSMMSLARIYTSQNELREACSLMNRIMEIPSYQEQFDQSLELFRENKCDQILYDEPRAVPN